MKFTVHPTIYRFNHYRAVVSLNGKPIATTLRAYPDCGGTGLVAALNDGRALADSLMWQSIGGF